MFKLLVFLSFSIIIGKIYSIEQDMNRSIEKESGEEDTEIEEGLKTEKIMLLFENQINDYEDAFLFINSTNTKRLTLSLRNTECVDCKFVDVANITSGRNISIRIDTTYPSFYFKIKKADTDEEFCEFNVTTFTERGLYQMSIDNRTCRFKTINETGFIYWPLVVSSLILASSAILYVLVRLIFKKICKAHYIEITQTCTECDITVTENNQETNESTVNSHNNEETNVYRTVCCVKNNESNSNFMKYSKDRLRFIDTFRGICIAMMIFINYGGGGYAIFQHAIWNGLSIPDLIFPGFIFIMGTSIALSMHHTVVQEINQNVNSGEMGRFNKPLIKRTVYKIVRRSVLLFLFGLLTSNASHVTFSELRIMGILQRLSISYFVCASLELIYLIINRFSYHEVTCFDADYNRRLKIFYNHFKEIIYYSFQWIIIIIISVTWVLITYLMPVPGCPTGYIGPGGLHNNGLHENCTGGAAGYIDRIVLGQSHLYPFSTYRVMYLAKLEFDSEGLLGCLTSCVLTFFGLTAGHILLHYKEARPRILRFGAYGILFGLTAGVLCNWSKEDGWMPINKHLWSISFVLAVASICFLVYIILYLVVDKWVWLSGKPFLFLGKNSICIYICHIVFSNFFPIQFYIPSTHINLVIMHIYGVTLWTLVAWYLYVKKIFIKI